MKVVWERESATVRDVYETLLEQRKVEIQQKMNQNPPEDEYNSLAKELWAVGQLLRK